MSKLRKASLKTIRFLNEKKEMDRMIEFTPIAIPPERPGHYLTISNMNWYHGGCFDDDRKTGLSLSYNIAYWNNGWNDPWVAAWADLPDFPEVYKRNNLKLLEERRKNLKPVYGTVCEIK